MLHFEITIISREENSHAIIKRQLKTFSEDFKIVINVIKLLLVNQTHNYNLAISATKIRYLIKLRLLIFQ